MSQPELKHCPFCGGDAGILATPIAIYISCEKCNFDVVYEDGETADAAVNHWNTRAEPVTPINPWSARIVMPERKKWDAFAGAAENMKSGAFNNALDEVYRLNASSAAPKGWKLVPVEPTSAMCEAGASVPLKNNQSEEEWIGDIYRAMIAAYRTQDDEIPMHPCVMQLDKLEIDK